MTSTWTTSEVALFIIFNSLTGSTLIGDVSITKTSMESATFFAGYGRTSLRSLTLTFSSLCCLPSPRSFLACGSNAIVRGASDLGLASGDGTVLALFCLLIRFSFCGTTYKSAAWAGAFGSGSRTGSRTGLPDLPLSSRSLKLLVFGTYSNERLLCVY